MTRILWLDDQPDLRIELVESLRADGFDIALTWTEEAAVRYLETEPAPDLFIQDLNRPVSDAQLPSLPPREVPTSPHVSGWAFYRDVLFPGLPQLPVVIVTWDADIPENRRTAEDFNLTILRKGDTLKESLLTVMGAVVRSQRTILAPQVVPSLVCVDFEKVTSALLRHLAKHPADIEQLSWSSFEDLVALLLTESGYEVTRTKLTRDGGVDLWALQRSDLGSTLYAIDAKKYGRSKVVGPEPVRAIYGVADLAGASAGMIVTTATFGPAARRLASQYRYRISLKDCDDVSAWIRKVGRSS